MGEYQDTRPSFSQDKAYWIEYSEQLEKKVDELIAAEDVAIWGEYTQGTITDLQTKVKQLETTVKDLVGVAQYSSYGRHYLRAYYPSLKQGGE